MLRINTNSRLLIRLTVQFSFGLYVLYSETAAAFSTHCQQQPTTLFARSLYRRTFALKMSDSDNVKESNIPLLHPSETALVLVEYQNEFTSPGGKLHDAVEECMKHTNMLQNSIELVQDARAKGCTIIHCPISFEPGHNEISKNPYGILAGVKEGGCFTAGEWGADFVDSMKPCPGDLVVKGKSGLCGFESTNLQFLLSQSGTKNIVLGGFLTNCCVESTMRSACE